MYVCVFVFFGEECPPISFSDEVLLFFAFYLKNVFKQMYNFEFKKMSNCFSICVLVTVVLL